SLHSQIEELEERNRNAASAIEELKSQKQDLEMQLSKPKADIIEIEELKKENQGIQVQLKELEIQKENLEREIHEQKKQYSIILIIQV
ncbi:MAG: hypothetical protein ACI4QG_01750, partial [Candidatus Cryptobacteroides sp.]